MKSSLKFLAVMMMGFLATPVVRAACDGVTTSCDPAFNVAPTVNITAITVSAKNSASTPNVVNTVYFFEATVNTTPSDIPDNVNGTIQYVGQDYLGNPPNPISANDVIASIIDPVVGGTPYYIFVQACPPGTGQPDSTGCSAWVSLGQVTTNAYPANPGFQSVTQAYTTPSSFTALTSSVQNANDVSAWQLFASTSDTDLPAGDSSLFNQQPYNGASNGGIAAFSVTSAMYSNLLPNAGYTATERLVYHYNENGPFFKISKFFTQPVDPVPGAITNVTHCSAILAFTNAAANPANPKDSSYSVNVGGVVTSGSATKAVLIGGVGSSGQDVYTDANSVQFTNLKDGQNFFPTVTVANRGGASWKNSNFVPYPGSPPFQTLSWSGNFSVTVTGTNTANFNVLSLDQTGIATWQIVLNGTPIGSPAAAPVPSTIALDSLTTLNPNVQYTVAIKLTETSGCNAILPVSGLSMTTTAADPTNFQLTADPTLVELHASWSDTLNPNTTPYSIKYCTDSAMTSNCHTQAVAAGVYSSAITNFLTSETMYWVQVQAETIGGGQNSNWVPNTPASATTPAIVSQAASVSPNPVNGLTGTLSVQVDGSNSAPGFTYNWVITPPAGVTNAPTPCANNNSSTGNSCLETFHQIGNGYSATVTVTDSLSRTITSNVTFNVVPVPSSVAVAPLGKVVNQGDPAVTYSVTANDQFGNAISNPPVVWTAPGGTGGNSFAGGVFTPNGSAGTYNINGSVTLNGTTDSAQTTVTVQQAAGSVTITGPSPASLNQLQTFTYLAVVKDQSGTVVNNPQITWSIDAPAGLVAGDPANTIVSALFTANNPGTYVVRAVASVNGSQIQNTSVVAVSAIPASVSVSPSSPVSVVTGAPQPFTATVLDPFNVSLPNAVLWQINGGGSLTTPGPSGTTTLNPTAPGSFTLTASSGTASANVSVTVRAAGPQFVQTPSFVLNASGLSGVVSASGSDNVAPQVTHTWSSVGGVSFNPASALVADNAVTTSTVTFTQAGSFTLTDTLNSSGFTVSASTTVVVPQELTSISVSPSGITIQTFASQTFKATCLDQFGNPMTPCNPTWSNTAGNVSGSGSAINFSSPGLGTGIEVTATATNPYTGKPVRGAATVNVISYDLSGAYAYPVPFKSTQGNTVTFTGLGSDAKIRIYTPSGRLVFNTEVTSGTYGWLVVNNSSQKVASGVYLYEIESPAGKKDGKLIIIQ